MVEPLLTGPQGSLWKTAGTTLPMSPTSPANLKYQNASKGSMGRSHEFTHSGERKFDRYCK